MHNGPTPHTPRAERCCGSELHVVALTRDDAAPSRVELVRCSACGLSSWRLDGAEVHKEQALGALSAAFAPSTPARKAAPVRARPQPTPAVAPPAELSGLLAGWQVLGSQ